MRGGSLVRLCVYRRLRQLAFWVRGRDGMDRIGGQGTRSKIG